jgi:hypothetical protein
MYFVSIYENKRIKSVEIMGRRRVREEEGEGRRVNTTNIYFKHICKCYNVFPCPTTIC